MGFPRYSRLKAKNACAYILFLALKQTHTNIDMHTLCTKLILQNAEKCTQLHDSLLRQTPSHEAWAPLCSTAK